jgi:hypothetical protein
LARKAVASALEGGSLPTKKPRLNNRVKSYSQTRGVKIATIARQLNLQPTTLRTWVRRNQYPPEALHKLATFLDLGDPMTLAERYMFRVTDPTKKTTAAEKERKLTDEATLLIEGLFMLDQRIEVVSKTQTEFGEDVKRLIQLMGKDDLMVYCSLDEIPFEIFGGWPKVNNSIRHAINIGAHLIYLYPDASVLKQLSGAVNVLHPDTFTSAFAKYLEDLSSDDPSGMLSIDAVKKQVHCATVTNPAFMAPQHSYRLFQPASDASVYRVLARFPTGHRSKNLPLHMPLGLDASEQFYRFVRFSLGNNPDMRKIIR